MFVDLLTRTAAAARMVARSFLQRARAGALAVVVSACMAHAQTTITVTTTADSGPGSLRRAIEDTNAGPGGTINFAIPVADPGFDLPGSPGAWRIAIDSPLPPISRPTVINGLTQTGSLCSAPKIELRPAAGASFTGDGLAVLANDCLVRGLVINGFIDSGVSLTGVTGCVISCNFIGTDVSGFALVGNGTGVLVTNGVANTIGGTDPGTMNVIAGNVGIGVSVVTTGVPSNVGNAILGNSIHDNGALGIDLGANGVTDNDNLDLDVGPNHYQNYPVIESFTGGTISATLNSLPNRRFRVEFFANAGQDPTQFGEGARFIGALEVMTSAGGGVVMSQPYTRDPGDRYVTATATALPPTRSGEIGLRGIAPAAPTGTSEFSRALFVGTGGGNTPPVAESLSVTTPEDTDVTVALMATDADGQTLTLRIASLPALGQLLQFGTLAPITSVGTVVTDAQQRVAYRPPPNVSGSPLDVFTYIASDGEADSNTATVTVNVSPVNDPPVAVDDAYSTDEDTPLTVSSPAAGVLANDTDPDVPPQTLTAVQVSTTSHGTLTFNADGTFTYNPQPNFNGTDTFTYRLSDGIAQSNPATVTITVAPVNDPPVARNDSYFTNEDVPLTVPPPGVLLNDSDVDNAVNTLSVTIVAPPINGTLSGVASGGFTYTPNANFNGTDTFTYRLSDGQAQSNTATVSIIVRPLNDPPVANDDAYTTDANTPLIVAAPGVLGNDSDTDSPSLTATGASAASHGVVMLASDGSFIYTPASDYTGPDSFTYLASDGLVNSNPATVSITVRGKGNLPPVARCRDVVIDARNSCPASFTITAADVNNGSDDPDDPIESLTLAVSNSGPFPIGSTGVTLTVTDPHGASSSCVATVTVLGSDCNGNGVPDACDIADGGSADCNHDGVPDECQCVWDNGMAAAGSGGRYSQLGGRAQVAAKVADDFYIEPGVVCHVTSFMGQMQTNLAPALRRARLDVYEDCDGSPAGSPLATFSDSTVIATEPGEGGRTLVTFSFNLCDANLWLDGGKTYWVSLYAVAGCADASESFWGAATASGVQGSTPRVALGRPSPYVCTNVNFDPWQPVDMSGGPCRNMAFKVGGAICPIIWDNGPYWHCPGGGGLASGRNGAFQSRSADNFVVMPCNDQTVCFIEATIWTNGDPNTGFVEVYANDCKRPGARLQSAQVSEVIPTGETVRIGRVDVHAYLLRFYDLSWVLPAGRTYWLSAGATCAGGSINQHSYFAIADTCGTGCDVHISPAWMGNVGAGGGVMWCPKTEDLSFRIGARPGVVAPPPVARAVACPTDLNGDGQSGIEDLFDYLTAWFAGCP